MSSDPKEGGHEIVIVRRRGGDDAAAAKGGAWKIAYADFVTAMMAFFLVMWLINASNEETRAQVASYFNPIKLTDNSTGKRGLRDRKEGKAGEDGEGEASAGGKPPPAADARHEAELMANPDKALEKIEAKLAGDGEGLAATGVILESVPSALPAEAAPGLGDPFDPKSWEKTPQVMEPEVHATPPPEVKSAEDLSPSKKIADPDIKAAPAPDADSNADRKEQGSAKEQAKPALEESSAPTHDTSNPGEAAKAAQLAEANRIAAEIAAALGTELDELPAAVDVRATDDGLLISLTDRQSFAMFKSGSAEPEPELVRLVEAIAAVLGKRDGYIVVRGHTDARPYRNKTYDNWQLSTARAHFAQYMLLRGGLDEKRVRRVEGLADREPRTPGDPQAPENRRIEILLGRNPA